MVWDRIHAEAPMVNPFFAPRSYVGDAHHPVIVYDYTPTRSRAGSAKSLEEYKGYLQADAYSVYDAFFKPQGMTEVGCSMHARRYLFKAWNTTRHGTGTAPHRTSLASGGAGQNAVVVGGPKVGTAPTATGSTTGKLDHFAPILRFGFRYPSNMPLRPSPAEGRFTSRLPHAETAQKRWRRLAQVPRPGRFSMH